MSLATSRRLATAAGIVYGTTASMGVGLATGAWRNERHRWVHHVGYIAAIVLTVATVATGAVQDPRRAALAAPALVPLAVLPRIPTRSRWHPVAALTAAPWLLAAAVHRTR